MKIKAYLFIGLFIILTIIEISLIKTGSILGLMLTSIGLFIMVGVGTYTAYIM